MNQKSTQPSALTPALRRRIIGVIASVVRRTFQHTRPPSVPAYPDAIPGIDGHIDDLVRAVRESDPPDRAKEIVKNSCPACPHQYPSRYCPLQARGGCVLYRCADHIAPAIATVLEEFDRESSASDSREVCHD